MNKNDSPLFYTCSLIEFIGRKCHQKRSNIVNFLGEKIIDRIYHNADILHCEVIDSVADRYIEMLSIPDGDYDNVSSCKYTIPDYWTIGAVYERLIEDVEKVFTAKSLIEIYNSWISDAISNYNTDFYYQSRDYIKECYLAGKII
ncbi:MAG: hypothetical protein II495_03130 [Paludibacteraceae bacterium]|nr:hypothetical protein [Paludibacteraceae bacterium]